MKRKEIKWRREGRRVMTGRQDGVIFRIWTPYDAPEKGYSVSSNDTKGRGRGHKHGRPQDFSDLGGGRGVLPADHGGRG